jgi:septum site-determining protein MinD
MMSVEDVLELLAIPPIGIVPEDERVIVSSNNGEPLVSSDKESLPAMAYRNIARRINGEKVDFIDFMATQDGFFDRIRRFLLG